MALPSTIHRFTIDVSDVDRGVYESLELRVARHPSETVPYLLTRVLARVLHTSDGVEFSKGGLCGPDEAPLSAHDLTGRLLLWVDLGSPSPERLHKAMKAADSVVVYCHKDPALLAAAVVKGKVHRGEDLIIYGVDREMLSALGETLDRNNVWGLVRTEGEVYITVGDASFGCELSRQMVA